MTKTLRLPSHPLAWFFAVSALCLSIEENFPFSNFPMYSHRKPTTDYYYLTTADGRPLATSDVTDLTTTKIKKMVEEEMRRIAKARRTTRSALPHSDHELAGATVLSDIRKLGLHEPGPGRTPMKDPVVLLWVHVALENGRLAKHTRELARN